jgi:hypothetical protein
MFESETFLHIRTAFGAFVVTHKFLVFSLSGVNERSRLMQKTEPPPARDANRESGTDNTNGG